VSAQMALFSKPMPSIGRLAFDKLDKRPK